MSEAKKSQLVPVGILLILAGLFLPGIAARYVVSGTLAAAVAVDGLRLCFFVGLALALIGWFRGRKTTPLP